MQLPNSCAKCEMAFPNWQTYYSHHLSATCTAKIRPVKLTSRTTKQIVLDVEARWTNGAIIKGVN